MFTRHGSLLLFGTLLLLAGCVASTPAQTEPPSVDPTVGATSSASIDPVLAGLVEASNRTEYAQTHDLRYLDGAVQVVVELDGNTSLPTGYDVRVEHRTTGDDATYVQAFVDVDDLQPLGRESSVRLIRPTQEPDTHGG